MPTIELKAARPETMSVDGLRLEIESRYPWVDHEILTVCDDVSTTAPFSRVVMGFKIRFYSTDRFNDDVEIYEEKVHE